jgi:hypothetical protein
VKEKFIISVDIDTDMYGSTLARTNDKQEWVVEIRKDINKICGLSTSPELVISTIAHEIGHILAYKCGLPKAAEDPRLSMAGYKFIPSKFLEAEKEAWDVANLIVTLGIAKKNALKTYEDGVQWQSKNGIFESIISKG